jgi:hypothetical protein
MAWRNLALTVRYADFKREIGIDAPGEAVIEERSVTAEHGQDGH